MRLTGRQGPFTIAPMPWRAVSFVFAFLGLLPAGPAPALPWQGADPAAVAMAGAGAALVDGYRPRLNPAAGALYEGRRDVSIQGLWSGPHRPPEGVGRRFLGGEVGLPQLPLSLGAFLQARFLRMQETGAGRSRTREAWRIESGADVAWRWRDRPGRGRRLAFGLSPKLVSTRLRARDGNAPLQVRHQGRLDLDAAVLGGHAFRWRWALVARDLFARGAPWPDGGAADTGPRLTAALAWRGPRLGVAADLDLDARHRLLGGRERRLALGLRWATPRMTWRAGLAPDLLGGAPLRWGLGATLTAAGWSLSWSTQGEGPGRPITTLGLGWAF